MLCLQIVGSTAGFFWNVPWAGLFTVANVLLVLFLQSKHLGKCGKIQSVACIWSFCSWLNKWTFLYMTVAVWAHPPPYSHGHEVAGHVLLMLMSSLEEFTQLWTVQVRLELMEAAFEGDIGAHPMRGLPLVSLVFNILTFVMPAIYYYIFGQVFTYSQLTDSWDLLACSSDFCFNLLSIAISWRAVSIISKQVEPQDVLFHGVAADEAIWAKKELKKLGLAITLPLIAGMLGAAVTLTVKISLYTYAKDMPGLRQIDYISSATFYSVVATTECACILFFLGVCSTAAAGNARVHTGRHSKATGSKAAIRRRGTILCDVGEGKEWNDTVQRLAKRSIMLGDLLDFFDLLGTSEGLMPCYCPYKSTTNDVVRMVIIPASCHDGYGMAYADTIVHDQALPQAIVTHTWSGLFLELVAAAVAEGLGAETYGAIAATLASPGGSDILRSQLDPNMLHLRLWICAFCVNQHGGICGSFGPEPEAADRRARCFKCDTATGQLFQLCRCHNEKHFDGPLCEMNKFDAMIQHIHSKNPSFIQIVVVDQNLEVFERAWCVAELVQCHNLGIFQRVHLPSEDMLNIWSSSFQPFARLATVKVVNCKASHPQDKVRILQKIPDLQAFDEHLHHIIFGENGFLHRALTGYDRLDAAVRAVRRLEAVRNALQDSANHAA